MSNTPNLIPSVEEVLDKPNSKKGLKMLNTDNSWNKEGILAAFDEENDSMVYCAASGVPLFYTTPDGHIMKLEPFGYCEANGRPYHANELAMSDDVSHGNYPIQYSGCYSKEEHDKPLSPEELADIRKRFGI